MKKGEEIMQAFYKLFRSELREPRVVDGPLPDKLPQFPHIIPERKEPER